MAQPQSTKKHSLSIENRERLLATGIERVDFSSGELVTAKTADGQMHIKGESLFIENLSAESGELLVRGKILAVSYAASVKAASPLARIFK